MRTFTRDSEFFDFLKEDLQWGIFSDPHHPQDWIIPLTMAHSLIYRPHEGTCHIRGTFLISSFNSLRLAVHGMLTGEGLPPEDPDYERIILPKFLLEGASLYWWPLFRNYLEGVGKELNTLLPKVLSHLITEYLTSDQLSFIQDLTLSYGEIDGEYFLQVRYQRDLLGSINIVSSEELTAQISLQKEKQLQEQQKFAWQVAMRRQSGML